MDREAKIGCWLAFLSAPLTSILQGWTIGQLWGWFIVPTFHAPALSIPVALGMGCIVGMFTANHSGGKSDDSEQSLGGRMMTLTFSQMLKPLIFLFFGWIYKQFM